MPWASHPLPGERHHQCIHTQTVLYNIQVLQGAALMSLWPPIWASAQLSPWGYGHTIFFPLISSSPWHPQDVKRILEAAAGCTWVDRPGSKRPRALCPERPVLLTRCGQPPPGGTALQRWAASPGLQSEGTAARPRPVPGVQSAQGGTRAGTAAAGCPCRGPSLSPAVPWGLGARVVPQVLS